MTIKSLCSLLKCYRYIGISPHSKLGWPFKATSILFSVLLFVLGLYNLCCEWSDGLTILLKVTGTFLVCLSILKPPELLARITATLGNIEVVLSTIYGVEVVHVSWLKLKIVTFNLLVFVFEALEFFNIGSYYTFVSDALLDVIQFFFFFNNIALQIVLLQHVKYTIEGISQAVQKLDRLQVLVQLHWQVCEVLRTYNNVFGPLMLLETMFMSFGVLANIRFDLHLPHSSWYSILMSVMNSAVLIVVLLVHCLKVEQVTSEFSRLSAKADGYLYLFKGCKRTEGMLERFCGQCRLAPTVTAMGFLAMDNSLVIVLFGLLSTFVILIAQNT